MQHVAASSWLVDCSYTITIICSQPASARMIGLGLDGGGGAMSRVGGVPHDACLHDTRALDSSGVIKRRNK